jgi:hypothetical protein
VRLALAPRRPAPWELAGLRWVDVDLDAGRASPRRMVVNYAIEVSEPKTAKGWRSVALDTVTVAALRKHEQRQAEDQAVVGPAWQDSGLVFTRPDGAPIHPDLSPTVDRDVVDLDPALGQQPLDVAVGQAEAQVPADREDDDIGCEAEAGKADRVAAGRGWRVLIPVVSLPGRGRRGCNSAAVPGTEAPRSRA